jgi:Tol biopolymer transport system component
MPANKNARLKTLVTVLWVVVVLAGLGIAALLVWQGVLPLGAPPAASQPTAISLPSLTPLPPLVETPTPYVPVENTPVPPASAIAPAPTILSPSPTTVPTNPPSPSPLPTAFLPRQDVLLFLGPDGCTVQAFSPAESTTTTLTLRQPADSCNQPQLSPDGTHLAFLMPGSYYTLYDMNLDGSGLKRISQGRVFGYAWSPDGRQLVYAAYIPDQGSYGLYFANADSSGRTNSAYPGLSVAPVSLFLAWSPDGKWVYAPVNDPSGADQSLPFALNVNGTDSIQISNVGIDPAAWVAWTPDSRSVSTLIFGYDYGYSVSLLNFLGLDGLPIPSVYYDDPSVQSNTLAPEGKFTAIPFWSPDGRRAVLAGVSSLVAGEYQLLVMDGATRAMQLLTDLYQRADLAAWSASGNRIGFLEYAPASDGGTASLAVINADGSGMQVVAQDVADSPPVWIQK